jgi:anti-sigma B factor antagonist
MAYTLTTNNDVQILHIDDLWNPLENQNLVEEISILIAEGKKDFVIDFTDMPYMNSNGLAFLISILTRARSAGGDVVIANVSEKIVQILLMTRLQDMFTTTDSVEEALEFLLGETTI